MHCYPYIHAITHSLVLSDVLFANPQSAKSDTVQATLDARYNLLSEEQRALIDENLSVLSAKELLEGELSAQMEQRDRYRDIIVKYYAQSDELCSKDSLISFLDRDKNLNSKYLKALEQFKNKDWAAMNSTLTDISFSNLFTEPETVNHNAFSYLLNLNRRLIQSGKSLLQIDSIQADSLDSFFSITKGQVNARIRNYLIHSGSLVYYEPVLLPGTGFKKGQVRLYPVAPTPGKPGLSVYPSPAKNYIIVEYNMDDNGFITITGIDGKQYEDIKLISPNGSKVIPIGNLSAGVYVISLFSNSKLINHLKFIKTK